VYLLMHLLQFCLRALQFLLQLLYLQFQLA
jgi:hypothetical protein